MSKARQLADLGNQVDDGAITGSNMVVNGGMTVAQRGVSQTAAGYGSVDRWYLYSSGGTYSQGSSGGPDGFSHYLKCAGATGSVIFAQAIELPATGNAGVFYNGQTINLSYYAKSTVAGDALDNPLSFRNSSTSTTNLVSIENDSTNNNVLTTSWAKYSKAYTIGVNVDPNNTCLVVQPRTRGAPSGDISITGVCLNVGDSAIAFPHESYGDTLAKCQRYYEQIDHHTLYSYAAGNAAGVSGTFAYSPLFYSVKRAAPSITGNGNFVLYDGSDKTVSGVTFQHITPQVASFRLQSTGLAAGRAYKVQFHSSGTRTIQINAEL